MLLQGGKSIVVPTGVPAYAPALCRQMQSILVLINAFHYINVDYTMDFEQLQGIVKEELAFFNPTICSAQCNWFCDCLNTFHNSCRFNDIFFPALRIG